MPTSWGHRDTRKNRDRDRITILNLRSSVNVPDREAGTGRGRSKRLAEQAAAAELLLREGVWKEEQT